MVIKAQSRETLRSSGVADTFLEKDGTKTEQSYSTSSSGGLIVTKKHIP